VGSDAEMKLWSARLIYLGMVISLLMLFGTAANAAGSIYIVNGIITNEDSANPEDDRKQIQSYSEAYNKYNDFASGISILYPAHMEVDTALSAVRTVIFDDKTRIEIYYDNFNGTPTSALDYIYYGNRFITNSPDHSIQQDSWSTINGYRTHMLKWTRRSLARVPDDKNNYACAEIVKNSNEVYTVFIKSSDYIDNAEEIVNSVNLFAPQGLPRNKRVFSPSATKMNAETQAFFARYFSPKSRLQWGIFEPSAPQSLNSLNELEAKLNFKFPFLLHYQMFDEYFPMMGLNKAYEDKRYVELTLQTVYSGQVNALWADKDRSNARMVYDILDGNYDEYFEEYARKLKAFGHPVIFRLNNEMNGDWCWYSAYYTSKDPELYKALWRYIHTIFDRNGVDNIVWVWNPHDLSRPDFKWNNYMAYYPGDEYVDIIGMTGYNTGTYFPGERWREFVEVYPPLYDQYSELFDKPFMITEFASNSVGGDKVNWIHRMFDGINKLDRIKVAIWWSGVDYDQQGQPGRIYLLNEDEAVINAFRERLKNY
jgi:hypothetical protein